MAMGMIIGGCADSNNTDLKNQTRNQSNDDFNFSRDQFKGINDLNVICSQLGGNFDVKNNDTEVCHVRYRFTLPPYGFPARITKFGLTSNRYAFPFSLKKDDRVTLNPVSPSGWEDYEQDPGIDDDCDDFSIDGRINGEKLDQYREQDQGLMLADREHTKYIGSSKSTFKMKNNGYLYMGINTDSDMTCLQVTFDQLTIKRDQ